jgi:hypothetical protein
MSQWTTTVVGSAVAYVIGTYADSYFVHDRLPVLSDLPDILVRWAIFVVAYSGFQWLGQRRKRPGDAQSLHEGRLD